MATSCSSTSAFLVNYSDDPSSSSKDGEWWSSWELAHEKTCRSRNTLLSTPQQVLDFTKTNAATTTTNDEDEDDKNNNSSLIFWSLPEADHIIPWNTKNNNDDVDEDSPVKAVCGHLVSNATGSQGSVPTETTRTTPEKSQPSTATATATTTTTPSSKKGMFQYVTETVFSPLKLMGVLSTPANYDLFNEEQEEDDALQSWDSLEEQANNEVDDAVITSHLQQQQQQSNAATTSTSCRIAWNTPILNLEMTIECLELLEKILFSQESSCTDSCSTYFPKIIPKQRRTNHQLQPQNSCWKDWIQEHSSKIIKNNNSSSRITTTLLTHLSEKEIDFLLDCLVQNRKITLISSSSSSTTTTMEGGGRQTNAAKADLIVLAPPRQQQVEGDKEGKETATDNDTYYQALTSWWELSSALESLEARREQWSIQADQCAQRAIQERKGRRKSSSSSAAAAGAGLVSFKMYKLYQQRVQETEGQIINLEQARNAIEEMWHGRQVVQALETSVETLRMIRRSSSSATGTTSIAAGGDLEEVDNLMETYREEMEQMSHVQQSLATTATATIYNEDELLKELEGLSLQDQQENNNTTRSSSGNNDNNNNSKVSTTKEREVKHHAMKKQQEPISSSTSVIDPITSKENAVPTKRKEEVVVEQQTKKKEPPKPPVLVAE